MAHKYTSYRMYLLEAMEHQSKLQHVGLTSVGVHKVWM